MQLWVKILTSMLCCIMVGFLCNTQYISHMLGGEREVYIFVLSTKLAGLEYFVKKRKDIGIKKY